MRVSIIVPVYNVENFISRCIDSILAQTFTDFELILVDDGSPDNCPAICDEYALKDDRIIVIHKEHGGLSSARNAGLDIARGEYISFVDSDDYIVSDFIEKMYEAVLNSNAMIALCGVNLVCDDIIYEANWWNVDPALCSGDDVLRYTELTAPYVVVWNKLYHKSIWQSLRFPVGQIHEDEFVAHHVYYACEKVVCLNEKLYYYRKNPAGIMNSKNSISRFNYFDALLDRIHFYRDIGYTEQAEKLLYNYYDQLRLKYFRFEDTSDNRRALKKYRKDAKIEYKNFFKYPDAVFTLKIATWIFLYFPKIYKMIWVDNKKV